MKAAIPRHTARVKAKHQLAPKFRPPKAADDVRLLRAQGKLAGGATVGHFETRRESRAEDRHRANKLRCWAKRQSHSAMKVAPGFSVDEARLLANELLRRQTTSGSYPILLASSASMRQVRVAYCGAVLQALVNVDPSEVTLFTIIPRKWRVRGNQLSTINPKKRLESLRAQLNRLGLNIETGWLLAFLHGDYDPFTDTWQLHVHILAVGAKGAVLQKLRKRSQYRSSRAVRRPIHQSQLVDPPRQLSYYLLQGFWPNRPRLPGTKVASARRPRSRIPEPRHSEWLMWMSRQKFTDLVWLHGCQIKGGRLVASDRHR